MYKTLLHIKQVNQSYTFFSAIVFFSPRNCIAHIKLIIFQHLFNIKIEAKQLKMQRDPKWSQLYLIIYIYIFVHVKSNGIKETNIPPPFDHFTQPRTFPRRVECAHARAHMHARTLGFTTVETLNGRAGIRWTKGRGERWSSKQTLRKVDAWKEQRLDDVARPPLGRHFRPSIGILGRRNPGGGCWRQSVFSVVVHACHARPGSDRSSG